MARTAFGAIVGVPGERRGVSATLAKSQPAGFSNPREERAQAAVWRRRQRLAARPAVPKAHSASVEGSGTTTRSKMRALRHAGAKEIHLRISCPPIRHPCFYGIDFATRGELVAHNRTIEQIRDYVEVDSIAYLSLEGMIACTRLSASDCCTACWSGQYKVPIDEATTKFSFERDQLKMF